MDSLDTWLNTRRGWWHFAVAWLVSLPAGLALGEMWVAWSNLSGPTDVGATADLERMALGVAASVPLAVLVCTLASLSRRRAAKRGKSQAPRYLWRGIVAIYLLIAGNAYSVWADTQPRQWRHDLYFAQISLDAIAIALLIWNLQYSLRLKRRAAEATANDLGSLLGLSTAECMVRNGNGRRIKLLCPPLSFPGRCCSLCGSARA